MYNSTICIFRFIITNQKKYKLKRYILGFGTTTLMISNEEMNDIIKIVQALKDSNILLKGVIKTIKNETKEQKVGFLSILLGTLGASLLGNLLTRKGIVRAGTCHPSSSTSYNHYFKGKGIVRAGTGHPSSSTS